MDKIPKNCLDLIIFYVHASLNIPSTSNFRDFVLMLVICSDENLLSNIVEMLELF